MKLDSDKIVVKKDEKACFEFLSQPGNYKELMPESAVKFEPNDKGGFNFQLKGMPEIRLKLDEANPNSKVVWGSASDQFKFNLTVAIDPIAEEESQVQFLFNGDFNPMIAMMAKSPLKKFIDKLSENLKKNYG